MLTIDNLNVYYGAVHAIKGVSLEVKSGETSAVIGANGAGKSTLLKTISGLIRAKSGSMLYHPEFDKKYDLNKCKPHDIVRYGIGHVPEGRRIFPEMTVKENLQIGAHTRNDNEIESDMERVIAMFPRLKERIKQTGGTLSGGEQQMLAIARALMTRPKLLLLDEPSLGLAPNLVLEIFQIIKDIKSTGATVVLVEQNAHMALEIADRGYVLETGKMVLSDTGKNLLNNPEVRSAYLGGQ